MGLKKLPIGIQTFQEIRTKNYIYIDKTKEAYELIENYKFTFLSRPRRFGKSLFLDTLHCIFEGRKELFENLYIYDKWNWKEKYPVIKISFKNIINEQVLYNEIFKNLQDNQKRLGVKCENSDYANCFEELIEKVYEKYNTQVVVLIDEYDKPILDVVEDIDQAKIHREIIKRLYSTLKEDERCIKFAFLTGVSKFSKASIFSGLNMIEDISLVPKFGNICGYTQKNIENEFLPYLDGVDLKKLKVWYNGYNFLKDDVYNPFDLLRFIKNDFVYKNYWFETGTPTFLIKLIEQNNYFLPTLANLVVGDEILNSFDIENINIEVLLYQAGYLTIEKMMIEELGFATIIKYHLKIPNMEVKISLNNFILEYLFQQTNSQKLSYQSSIYKALAKSDLEAFKNILQSLFASIPYNNFTNNSMQNYEGFYASVIYVYLQSLGLDIIGEDVTNLGRIDLTVKIEDKIYIIEFKMGDSDALKQIKEKQYTTKYLDEKKDIYLVGINFDKNEKNIIQFEWESIDSIVDIYH
ncbi:FIG00914433: hypothetical protein [hydrothermal vent metagenome]|uniref:AAA-ATPase-like domain-containing protein n=2 Tax=hydrothermal vent metagenome TaxID=652676 RepID=A0A1W1BJJ0_9ZZZZ